MNIPPLSQSRYEQMACPEQYTLVQIDGVKTPPSEASDRGDEVHHVMSQYVHACAIDGISSDWEAFDRLASAVGSEAGQIVDGLRDNYVVDWEHFYGAEQYLALDENFDPYEEDLNALIADRKQKPHYEGTLDAIFFPDAQHAQIDDYKSHWRPFDPDTFQSKLYPFLLFQHFGSLEEVTFTLIFVRFKSARRSVTYTRDDLPALAAEIERARKRQIALHKSVSRELIPINDADTLFRDGQRHPMDATPGPMCIYCPHLAKGTCPLGDTNPYGTMTLEDRLKHVVQIDQARKFHLGIIKDYVDNSLLPVSFEDGSGNKYEAAFRPTESGYYPLVETTAMLMEYTEANPDDKTLFNGLRVGSSQLKPKLKAKKRIDLDQRLRDSVMVKETAVRFGIKGVEEEEEEG